MVGGLKVVLVSNKQSLEIGSHSWSITPFEFESEGIYRWSKQEMKRVDKEQSKKDERLCFVTFWHFITPWFPQSMDLKDLTKKIARWHRRTTDQKVERPVLYSVLYLVQPWKSAQVRNSCVHRFAAASATCLWVLLYHGCCFSVPTKGWQLPNS